MNTITLVLMAIVLPYLWGEISYFLLSFCWNPQRPKPEVDGHAKHPAPPPDFQI